MSTAASQEADRKLSGEIQATETLETGKRGSGKGRETGVNVNFPGENHWDDLDWGM